MKIRHGFVSNSSSSSFICNLNCKYDYFKEQTFDEIKEKLNDMIDTHNRIVIGNDNKINKDDIKVKEMTGKEYIDFVEDYGFNISSWMQKEIKKNKKYPIIYDIDDNTIPYFLNEWIKEIFYAEERRLQKNESKNRVCKQFKQ